jgi:hypothetical protein
MPKQEFLNNIRAARNLFVHPHAQEDSPGAGAQTTPERLARAAIWLAPKSVRGFDAADFGDLGSDRQRKLEDAVADFLAVANQVPLERPPTAEDGRTCTCARQQSRKRFEPKAAMPLHTELLHLAVELVTRNPGAPVEGDLRRGVS